MAIVELFNEHKVGDIVEVNGEIHVITTVFGERAYQTMPLKTWIEAHTVSVFDGEYMTVADYLEKEANRLWEEGHV